MVALSAVEENCVLENPIECVVAERRQRPDAGDVAPATWRYRRGADELALANSHR
jgi:hypothetical protein